MKNIVEKLCNIHFLPLILFFMGWANISAFQPEFYWRVELQGVNLIPINGNQENYKPEDYQVEHLSPDQPSYEPYVRVMKNGIRCQTIHKTTYIENELLKIKHEIPQKKQWMDTSLFVLLIILVIEAIVSAIYFIVSRNGRGLSQVAIECLGLFFIAVLLTFIGPNIYPMIVCRATAQISAELIKITWVGQESLVIGILLVLLAFIIVALRNTTFLHQRFFVESKAKQDGQDA